MLYCLSDIPVAERPDRALPARIKSCADDTLIFEKKLKGLAMSDDSGLKRRWNKLRTFVNEKYLEKMGAVIVGHTAGLNLHLQVLVR